MTTDNATAHSESTSKTETYWSMVLVVIAALVPPMVFFGIAYNYFEFWTAISASMIAFVSIRVVEGVKEEVPPEVKKYARVVFFALAVVIGILTVVGFSNTMSVVIGGELPPYPFNYVISGAGMFIGFLMVYLYASAGDSMKRG